MLVDVDARNSDNPVPVPVPLSSMTDNGHYDDCVDGETRSIQGSGPVAANWSSLSFTNITNFYKFGFSKFRK